MAFYLIIDHANETIQRHNLWTTVPLVTDLASRMLLAEVDILKVDAVADETQWVNRTGTRSGPSDISQVRLAIGNNFDTVNSEVAPGWTILVGV